MGSEVDAGFRVLDDGAVLDVGVDLVAADRLGLADVHERPFADDCVGSDPERGTVAGHALMEDVLDVGGGACHAFDARGCPAEGGIRCLGHGNARVLIRFQEIDKAQAVVPQEQRIRIKGQQVLGVWDVQDRDIRRRGSVGVHRPQHRGVSPLVWNPPGTHQ